ncbi:GDP-fucose protein O-fucosyltransferase 2 isoform X1 [Neodiprion pinetum]|uniref:GDP-fucose protein O-fucosyltransferase 2 isoform X1 n=1 Tax=Neodiprion pinetum TaxID=441929 RepID=UPI001EDD0F9A|nr:GDP-fucose protein O-fucosyltransferase 2 isoform X1 [Neodiprion pinetum]
MVASDILLYFFLLISADLTYKNVAQAPEYCGKKNGYALDDKNCFWHTEFTSKRYILYDVNPPEGFNLRRDVYLRTSIFVRNLSEKSKKRYQWHLVLPPWGNLYHWRSTDIGPQKQIPWSTFFDLESLKKYVPVIEMHEFIKEYSQNSKTLAIDRVYILQNDEKMFETGNFDDKNQLVNCTPDALRKYQASSSGNYGAKFWGYSNVTANEVKCLVYHGTMSGLEENLYPDIYSSVMFDHMEIPLHDSYGTKEYWAARRSMRYNSALYEIANDFSQKYLKSNDSRDKTELPMDWTKEKSKRNALGGPYLCVHLRRRDFLIGRAGSVPTIKNAASQLSIKMEELNLQSIFIATDAENNEYNELKSLLNMYAVTRYTPSDSVKKLYKDGGVAIIDQIICSKARYFIGTHESTFTFRIQEDREIMGFPSKMTFNELCGIEKCKSRSSWKILW